jgi:hypothetical protein
MCATSRPRFGSPAAVLPLLPRQIRWPGPGPRADCRGPGADASCLVRFSQDAFPDGHFPGVAPAFDRAEC